MNRITIRAGFTLFAAFSLLVLAPLSLAGDESQVGDDIIVVGGQAADVDTEDGRDTKFEQNRDIHEGLALDYLRWNEQFGRNWIQFVARDAGQLDEAFGIRAGLGDKFRLRANYQSLPYRVSDGATFVLARGADDMYGPSYRIADFIQMNLEDPDGNGTPFFTDAIETAGDNALAQTLMSDILMGQDPFSLASRRRAGNIGLTFLPTRNWTFDLDVDHETRDGAQALGSGTYQRITDVNGDAATDYNYFFSIRGIEIPAIIDYRTSRVRASANYHKQGWFLSLAGQASEFDNQYLGITYDNPFWYNGIDATSGSRRGLWEEGRVSLEPSNKAWHLSATGGVDLPRRTRITAAVSIGEHSQNEPFLPITTNPATIATADINRDGSVDLLDDPTLTPAAISGMPATIDGTTTIGESLDATSDTTAINLTISSRPVKKLTLRGRYRSYTYEGNEGIQVIPARTEYIESHVKLDFKNDLILHVPIDYTREVIDLEAGYRFTKALKVEAFMKRKSYDYDQYTDPDGNSSRDTGSRAVAGTDDDIIGIRAAFKFQDWFSGRASWEISDREYDGTYTTGFSGENSGVRQYDIANRERDAGNLQLDFMPTQDLTLGVGYSLFTDEYPDTEYGYQEGEGETMGLSLNYAATDDINLFMYADQSEWDVDMHLRTKCSNCTPPPGALWSGAWNVPNFDWFSEYEDSTTAIGAGISIKASEKTYVGIEANYLEGTIEQLTENPDTPTELDPANPLFGQVATVALGYDFTEQENVITSVEFKLVQRLTDHLSVGLWWLYEDFDLDDFQWDDLQPYGNDFLTVDDPTRFLFLDSRYSDYTAHVVQAFMKMRF